MTNFDIKVISDVICPFCYLGKRRLEKAIAAYRKTSPADTFTVTWRPFYLDPTLPATTPGEPIRERLARKFGGGARLEAMHARMAAAGAAEGIAFSFDGRVGSTRDAHRLLRLGEKKGPEAQDRLVESLFKAYHEEGGDITSRDMLVGAAERGGIEAAEARRWLESGAGGDEVDRLVAEAYARGVQGVPHFVINDRFEVSGAQDVRVFLEEFARAKKAASS